MPHRLYNQRVLKGVLGVLPALVCLLFFGMVAHAATLTLSPASGSVAAGDTVTVTVLVNADGTAINTAQSTLHFPSDILQAVSINQTSSIFPFWLQNSAFSNAAGTVSFSGGLPTPGFSGQNGKIISVIFKAKKAGTAAITLSDSSVLANDGQGTDVFKGGSGSAFQIDPGVPTDTLAPATATLLPPKPSVISSTHPQQNVWYSGTSASFSWVVPNTVTALQTSLSQDPNALPTIKYDSSVSQRTVNNLADGVLYFHIRYINNVGAGPMATYKVQIDSTPPDKFTADVRTQGAQNILTLKATDATSGIGSYSVKIDDGSVIQIAAEALVHNEYVLPTQVKGPHNLTVIAYDRAGNHTESDTFFTSPDISVPTVSVSPVSVTRGDIVTVQGKTAYPHTGITIFIQSGDADPKTYSTQTTDDGSYSIVSDRLNTSGLTNIWAQSIFSETIHSLTSNKVVVQVNDSTLVQTSKNVLYGLSYVIPTIALVMVLLALVYIGWHKFFGLRRKLRKEVQGTVNEAHRAFMLLKDELNTQLDRLEKMRQDRDLNKKEEKIFAELKTNIDALDEFIEKRLKRIK